MWINDGTNEQHALSLIHLPYAGRQLLQREISHKAQQSTRHRGEQAAQAIRSPDGSCHTCSDAANAQ